MAINNKGDGHVKICMELINIITNSVYHFYILTNTNMAVVQNSEVTYSKFNVYGICTSEIYIQKVKFPP